MKALVEGTEDVRVETVPDPKILNPAMPSSQITSSAICGSDLHIYAGYIPTCRKATSSAMSSWARSSRSARQPRV